MKILVANLGSTSFKYRLFDMDGERVREDARGGVERIGSAESLSKVEIGDFRRQQKLAAPDHAAAVRQCLAELTDPQFGCLEDAAQVSAIGFKAVHGGAATGVQRVTEELLAAMEQMSRVAPGHNPPYIRAMRLLHEKLPEIPLVAVFETDFHRTIPDRNRFYAVPHEWAEKFHVRRWGFHGASHRYIATRTAELLGKGKGKADASGPQRSTLNAQLRIISCHLGGSSSICAIRDGQSVATSMGMSPQSGLPQNNRAGDFDPFAIPVVMEKTGKSLGEVLDVLAGQSGLAGLSGVGGDLRDLDEAVEAGNARAQLALDVFASSVRHYLGAYLVELGGAEAIVFTGGIGENRPAFREMVCRDLEELGIVLDGEANRSAAGEVPIHAAASRTEIWVVPTNEELIVARLAKQLLEG